MIKLIYIVRSTVLSVIIIMMLSSCLTKNKTKKDSLNTADSFYVEVVMQNDTLMRKEEKGFVKFHYKIADTLKIVPEDKRSIFCALGIAPIDGAKNGEVYKTEKEIKFTPINSNDTIQIPFSIIPNFSGKSIIIGIILDRYFLNSYYGSDKFRMLSYEQIFEKEIYIKGGNGRDGR